MLDYYSKEYYNTYSPNSKDSTLIDNSITLFIEVITLYYS